jgi:hypothetical protein
MHPLAKRIALLFSAFSLVIGLFLLGYNLQLISAGAVTMALNLWPVLLVAAGFMLLGDSARKRVTARASTMSTREYALPIDGGSREVALTIHFSYGRLVTETADGAPRLITESWEAQPAPVLRHDLLGNRSEVSVSVSQPLFPSHRKAATVWRLQLPARVPLRLSLQLHEADLRLDLRGLQVESLEMRTEAGSQEVLLGTPRKKITGQIYCSGSSLSLVLPARVFAVVRRLNPFCRVDYPQGDIEKREDGSLVTPAASANGGSVEIEVDGPIRDLVLDIEEAEDSPAAGET